MSMTLQAGSVIDESFDADFASRSALPWFPWVGARFQSMPVRTMLVGESVYDWDEKGVSFKERYAKPDGLRITHTKHAMDFSRNSRYVRNIERAIYKSQTPSDEQKHNFWLTIAYHNLVLRPMRNVKQKPGEADYVSGWAELLDLCLLMGVQQCLVYGAEHIKRQALLDVAKKRGDVCTIKKLPLDTGRSSAYLATLMQGEKTLKILFIDYPSAYFSWRNWAPVIHKHLTMPVITGEIDSKTAQDFNALCQLLHDGPESISVSWIQRRLRLGWDNAKHQLQMLISQGLVLRHRRVTASAAEYCYLQREVFPNDEHDWMPEQAEEALRVGSAL